MVDCTGLENRRTERYRGFESLSLRLMISGKRIRDKIEILDTTMSRAFSSAGSERLPYKQRVGGSNPSTPTIFLIIGSLAQLNRAFDYGSKGYRFESCASHA